LNIRLLITILLKSDLLLKSGCKKGKSVNIIPPSGVMLFLLFNSMLV